MSDMTKMNAPSNVGSEKIFDDFEDVHDSGLEFQTENKDMMNQRRTTRNDDTIYDLTDVVENHQEESVPDDLDKQIIEKISDITERIAREMFPGIAERMIREEIDKLKQEVDESEL